LQAGGHRFDPGHVHQSLQWLTSCPHQLIPLGSNDFCRYLMTRWIGPGQESVFHMLADANPLTDLQEADSIEEMSLRVRAAVNRMQVKNWITQKEYNARHGFPRK
jgi:hypothetical protein